jgi:hypothetical protein
MYIELTPGVPGAITLHEADDFTSLKAVVRRPEHIYVGVDELRRLAGSRADDHAWGVEFEQMIAYAESKGWRREDGALRVHVEWAAN